MMADGDPKIVAKPIPAGYMIVKFGTVVRRYFSSHVMADGNVDSVETNARVFNEYSAVIRHVFSDNILEGFVMGNLGRNVCRSNNIPKLVG